MRSTSSRALTASARENRSGWVALRLALGFACVATEARAEPDPSTPRLEWYAPPECIRAEALNRAVTIELERPAFDPHAKELVVRGRVTREVTGLYRAEVALEHVDGDAIGVRSLTSDNRDCRSLDEALAVMLGIMLNVGRRELTEPEPSPWSYRLALGGFGTLGRLPGPGAELALGGGVTLPGTVGFEAELGLEGGPSKDVAEGSVSARAYAARLGVSPVIVRGPPELALRFAFGGGLMSAEASGFDRVKSVTRPTAEARGGVRISLPLSRPLWLEVEGDVGVALLRPRFTVRDPAGAREELFRPAPIFGSLGIYLAFRPR